MEKEKTWMSVCRTISNINRCKSTPEWLKEKIKDVKQLYFTENKTPDEIFYLLSKIKIKDCDICGSEIFLFDKNCKNIGIIYNPGNNWKEKDDNDCNEFELKHKYWRFQQNSKIFKRLHKEKDRIKFCQKCNSNTKHIIGIGCMSCYNKTDDKRKASTQTMIKNWQNEQWAKDQTKRNSFNNFKAKKSFLEKIKNQLNSINITFNNKNIDYYKIKELKENDICGAYVIKAKFKNYKGSPKENLVFNLLACKSNKIYKEIYWILRVLSQPEKQDKIVSEDNPWTIAKWWYISNLYYDFEFVLITNENGVSEEEALLTETKYGLNNNMICDKEQIITKGFSETHSYWNL